MSGNPRDRLHGEKRRHFDEACADVADLLAVIVAERDAWVQNAEFLLSNGDPDVIRCREGGGPENVLQSLILTVSRTRSTRDRATEDRDHSRREIARTTEDFTGARRVLNDQLSAARTSLEEAEGIIRDLLANGLNGANNVRLAFLSAGGKELSQDLLDQADRSEDAVKRADNFLKGKQ